MAAEGVYVYAIVRAAVAPPSDVGGVGSPPAPLRSIRRGKVAAVVSEAPPKLRARRRDLLAHQDLLQRLAEDGPVLPMRFGVVAPDEESVRRQLARAEGEHVAALERLSGGVEVNMKAFPAQSGLSSLIAEDRNVRHLRDEARRRPGYEASLRLGEAVAAALAARAAAAGRRILRELTLWHARWLRDRTYKVARSTCRFSLTGASKNVSVPGRSGSPTHTVTMSSYAWRGHCPATALSPPKAARLRRPPESEMGLITGLLTLPIAPVRGVVWVAGKLQDAAERELHDPSVLRAQLTVLNQELEDGFISLEEFEREEDRLLERLHAAEASPTLRERR